MLAGADVSSWQGEPGQWLGETGDIAWAGVKLTELQPGGVQYVNPDAAADWAYLKQAGLGRVGYMFARPSVSAAASVALLVSTLAQFGLDDDDAVAIDLEQSDGLSPAQVSGWARDAIGRLQRQAGRRPLVYTFLSFAAAGNCAGLGRYPLWIADPSSPAGHPGVPAPWSTWAIHQYSITGPVDLDTASYPSLAAMRAALGRAAAQPLQPAEDPVLILTGPNTDTPIALPDGAKSVRLVACGETTVNVQFPGGKVQQGVKLSWGHGQVFSVPAGAHSVRVFRPADGSPEVPVSAAVTMS
jgi:lysozyme